MDWLNYHHLRYFWMVAKLGSLRRAAEKLGVSQPSISTQITDLERALGVPLFRRQGRSRVLAESGQVVFRFADEIFSLGGQLLNAVRQQPTALALRLQVGVADSFPKVLTGQILQPVLGMPQVVHVQCREGKLHDLLARLADHQLDIVLADEPAPSDTPVRTYNHPLGESPIAFCATGEMAAPWQRGFPRSLHGTPAFLPAENTPLRRSVEAWFRSQDIQPRVVAEFDDLALMKVMAAEGRAFIALPKVVAPQAASRYGFRILGVAESCRIPFLAITAERRLAHPAVVEITRHARQRLLPEIPPPAPLSSRRTRKRASPPSPPTLPTG